MNRLGIGTYHVLHPSKWDECTPDQVRRLALLTEGEAFRNWQARAKDAAAPRAEVDAEYYRLRIEAFLVLLQPKWRPRLLWLMLTTLKAEHYVEYLNHPDKPVDWVWHPGLTKTPFRSLRPSLLGPTYHGPKDGMADTTLYEFLSCAERYKAYVKTNSLRWAEEMIEILYRPLGPALSKDGVQQPPKRADIRTYDHARHKGWAAALDEGTRLSIIAWWKGNMAAMQKRYTVLFDGAPGKQAGNPEEMILRIAGSPKNTDVEEAATALIHNVLSDMNRQRREAIEAEAIRKRNTR